jgi:aldehyde dehydrogenase (NAD+)
MYVFSANNSQYDDFLERTSSGSFAFNDTVIQCALECLPFGGVGESGLGSYHGKYSIEAFSHRRAVLKGSFFGEALMG